MPRDEKPFIAISMGDPAGIGPEICLKALPHPDVLETCRPVVVGDRRMLEAIGPKLTRPPTIHSIERPSEGRFHPGILNVIDLRNADPAEIPWGQVSRQAGQAAFEYVLHATDLTMTGQTQALVTAPFQKEAINLAGHHYAGHTELLTDLTRAPSHAMMLAVGRFRVAHVAGHVALREACDRVRLDRILEVIRLSDEAMRRIGIAEPSVAVAALNPHGGEAGLFGREEIEEIAPAVEAARAQGIMAFGPMPADTMMAKVAAGAYDVAIAMYHDQGHVAIKLIGFQFDQKAGSWSSVRGVNVTLGLPIVRTSVDHGTAFDIAGRGIASEASMVDAIEWAVALAGGDSSRILRPNQTA